MQEPNDPGRMPSQIVYSPATQRARLGQADADLMSELEQDGGVQEAHAALEQAQARLQMAVQVKDNYPYPGGAKPSPSRLRDWQNAASAWTGAKEAVATAEKGVTIALNLAARARRQSQQRQSEQERAQRHETEITQHAEALEAAEREKALPAYLASGGTKEMFESWFPGHYKRVVAARAEERMGEQTRQLRASGRYRL